MEKQKIIEGLKIALQTELNGVEFYKMAAEKTEDAKGKDVFRVLANDEVQHYNELRRQFQSLINSSKWQQPIELGELSIFEGVSPIFSEDMKLRVKDRHFEMSALSIGVLLESNSVDFYRKMQEEIDDPLAKELFARLQKWEEGHLEAIVRQLDLLKEDYWAEAQFAPLF